MAMRRGVVRVACVVSVVVLGACRVVPLPMRDSITPPPALSMQEVEAAILETLRPPSLWTVDAREPAVVYAVRSEGDQALRVAIDYTAYSVSLRVAQARNLDWDGARIDRRALEWMEALDAQLRQSLGAPAGGASHDWSW